MMAKALYITEDRFDQYYSEKIWEMIPAIYRHEDGIAEPPGVLRAMIEIIAKQASNLRRSHDRLWEDQFVELCNDWAVPYIGDLVATRLVSALNTRARKVDVAKTIYYRRRKGTVAILEELISDIAGWNGKVVESFRRLSRVRHMLDPSPTRFAGRYTRTLPGGLPNIRNTRASELAGKPFEEYFHLPDLRRPEGKQGRYGIKKILFHLYRVTAYPLRDVNPLAIIDTDGRGFRMDPSGRDISLFIKKSSPQQNKNSAEKNTDWGQWRTSFEWELPSPMSCRLLNHAEFKILSQDIRKLKSASLLTAPQATKLALIQGMHFPGTAELRHALTGLEDAVFQQTDVVKAIKTETLTNECGKESLYPDSVYVSESTVLIERGEITGGSLKSSIDPLVVTIEERLVIDPVRGRIQFVGELPTEILANYHYGLPGEVGAGTYHRPDVEALQSSILYSDGDPILVTAMVEINSSATFSAIPSINNIRNVTFFSTNGQRPYLSFDNHWNLEGAADDSTLVLDGLWVGGTQDLNLVLSGSFDSVMIINSTIDPGGLRTESLEDLVSTESEFIPRVKILIEGMIDELIIDSSIIGPITVTGTGRIKKLTLRDSIVQSVNLGESAISVESSDIDLVTSTILGNINAQCLYASDSLIFGKADIKNTQCGCFRFSAVFGGSRVPHPYESVDLDPSNYLFASQRFGNYSYLQLVEGTTDSIARGGSNGSEMGVYNQLIYSIKMDSLKTKAEEYMPFGLLPVFIFET